MGAKRFGAKDLTAGEEVLLMTGQEGFDSTVVVTFVNRSEEPAFVYLAYIGSTEIADLKPEDFLLYNKKVLANDSFAVTGIAVEQLTSLVVRSNNNGVGVLAYGYEEEIQ